MSAVTTHTDRDLAAERRVVRAVTATTVIYSLGTSAVLPILPIYLRGQGNGASAVGLVVAAYFVAGVLTQYASGWLTDRVGPRRIVTGGLAVYAVASAGFVLSVSTGGYVALRALQGLGAGGVTVAGMALIAATVPAGRRGSAVSRVLGGQLAGMAIGPMIGSAVGSARMSWLFLVTAAAAVVAIAPVAFGAPPAAAHGTDSGRVPISRGLVGVVLVSVATGCIAGAYETCWSLLMASRGAAVWQVGMSWTLFAIPFAAISPWAGRLADRHDRRQLVIWGMLGSAAFAVAYPFLPSTTLLMTLGMFESVAVALTLPAAQSLLADTVPAWAIGRAQGLFTTGETAAIAVAAAVAGWMFGVARWLPFVAAAAAAVALTAVLPRLWRDVAGRATPDVHVSPPRQPAIAVVDATASA